MTTPNFDFLDKKLSTPTSQSNLDSGVDFSFLDKPEEEADVLSGATNVLKNLHLLAREFLTTNPDFRIGMGVSNVLFPNADEKDLAQLGTSLAGTEGTSNPAVKQAISDIRNMFGKFGEDPKGAINSAVESVKKQGVSGVLKGLPAGMISMVSAPLSSVTGLGFDRPEFYALTPEQRAAEIKMTAGNVVGMAAGMGAGKVVGGVLGQSAEAAVAGAAAEGSTRALMQVTRSLRVGALGRKMLAGTIEGSAFGTAQAAVSSANQQDQLTNIIVNGILFAPVGGALHTVFGHDPIVKETDIGVKNVDRTPVMKDLGPMGRANDILKLRQLELAEDLSINDVAGFVQAFATSDNIMEAIVKKQLQFDRKEVLKIDVMDPKEANDLITKINADATHPLTGHVTTIDNGFGKGQARVLLVGKDISSDLVPSLQEIAAGLRTGEETVGMGYDPRLVKTMGENLYKGKLAKVVTKELIQNAHDAVIDIPSGRVRVNIDSHENTVRVSDNGHGMLPEVAQKEFLDVGGSVKGANSAGGFGLAKIAIFSNAESIHVETVAKSGSDLIRTTIDGSGDDWINGKMSFKTEKVKGKVDQGTTTEIKLNPNENDPRGLHEWYDAEQFVRTLGAHHLSRMDLEAYQNWYGTDRPIDFSRLDYNHVDNLKVPGATIEVYESSKTAMETSPMWPFTDAHVLNNGLPQFNNPKTLGKEAPGKLLFNVKPEVPPTDSKYPFTASREELKVDAEKAIDDYIKNINEQQIKRETLTLAKRVTEPFTLPNSKDVAFYVTDGTLSSKTQKLLQGHKFYEDLHRALDSALDDIFTLYKDQPQYKDIERFHFGGFGLSPHYLGVNIKMGLLGDIAEKSGLNLNLRKENMILVNPHVIAAEVGYNPSTLAARTWGTIIHEVAHQIARGHDEQFAGVMTRVVGHDIEFAMKHMQPLIDAYKKAVDGGLKTDTDEILADLQGSKNDIKKISGHESGLEAGDIRGTSSVSNDERSIQQTTSSNNQSGIAPRLSSESDLPTRSGTSKESRDQRSDVSKLISERRKGIESAKDIVPPVDVAFFKRTGFLPNETVSVRGKNYMFKDLRGEDAVLINGAGEEVVVPASRVRANANGLITTQYDKGSPKIDLAKVNRATMEDRMYRDWKNDILEDMKNVHAQIPRGANKELIGFDDLPPSRIADVTPTKTFDQMITDFMQKRGLPLEQRNYIIRDFEQRLHAELMQDIVPEEAKTFKKLIKAADEALRIDAEYRMAERQLDIDKLAKSAESNGYYIDHEGSQTFVLRDAESDIILHRGTKLSDMQKFIDATGQKQGIELDGGGGNGVPPRMFGTLQPIPDGPLRPNEVPFVASPDGWMGNITSAFNSIADFLTPNREILIGIDNKYGTKLFSEIYDKTQVARARANAAIMPWYQKLQKIEAIDKRMSKGEREVVAGHLETMSADEVRQRGGGGGRPLNDVEKGLAQALVDTKGDINKAFKFNRQLELEYNTIKDNDPVKRNNAYDVVRAAFAMTTEDLKAAELLRGMTQQKLASIGPTVRLARTIQNGGGMTRAEYAAHHKMTPKQLAMSNQLESLFKELAPQFGIDEANMLQNYMTHARLYAKGEISGALNHFDIKGANKEFYAKMVRTGEIDAYETDPIRAAQRYIKAGFDAKLFDEAKQQAVKSLNAELLKVPDEAQRKVKHVVERYLNDLQGSPGPAAQFTQNTVNRMLDGLGINVGIDVRKNIVNTIAATGEAAAQGFRLVAGIRDFYTGVSLYFARFGVERTARMLKLGLTGLDNLSRQSLSETGVIPTLSQVAFDTPTEFTSTVLGRSTGMIGNVLRKTGEVGLKLSGQKDVYALLHAGSYLDSWSLAGEQLRKLNRGEITKMQAYKKLHIESYHLPVAQEFDRLVTAGKFDDAAQFLGRVTGQEQVGVFGLGNNPGGWNTNVGRIAGQFGSWSMWYRAHMMQMASRGSYGYRAAAITRLAATQAVLVGVGAATGLRLGSWYTPPGILFAGGPLVQAFQTVNDAVSGYGPEQKLAQSRLKKFLPYDGERFNFGQIYIPGSYFANDLARAFQAAQEGQSVPAVAAQAVGFRFQKQ